MIQKVLVIVLLIPHFMGAMMPPSRARAPRLPPCKIKVINTNDAGPHSLRNAVEKCYKYPKYFCGIRFNIVGIDNPIIILNTDIIIEGEIVDQGYKYTIDTEDENSVITIQGKGSLLIKSPNVIMAENIKRIMQPKSLVELATLAVDCFVLNKQIEKAKLHALPSELQEQIKLVHKADKQREKLLKKSKSRDPNAREISLPKNPCIIQ